MCRLAELEEERRALWSSGVRSCPVASRLDAKDAPRAPTFADVQAVSHVASRFKLLKWFRV